METYRYMGEIIRPCERAKGEHGGAWIVQSYHSSGTPYSDDLCSHHPTLKQAKEDIRIYRKYRE